MPNNWAASRKEEVHLFFQKAPSISSNCTTTPHLLSLRRHCGASGRPGSPAATAFIGGMELPTFGMLGRVPVFSSAQAAAYRSLSAMYGLRRRPAAVCSSRRSAARRGAGRQPDSTAACMHAGKIFELIGTLLCSNCSKFRTEQRFQY